MKFKLGDKVKDKITGFEGIVIARIEYLNGCIQYGVKARVKDAALKEAEYIDEGQIERLGPGINKPSKKEKVEELEEEDVPVIRSGGDQPDSPQKKERKSRNYFAGPKLW